MNISTIVDSYFGETTLTGLITKAPYAPHLLQDEKIFSEAGIATTKAMIDLYNSQVVLLPDQPRGSPPKTFQRGKRSMVGVNTCHYTTRHTIYADTWQDVRALGEAGPEYIGNVQNRVLGEMRRNLDATIEYVVGRGEPRLEKIGYAEGDQVGRARFHVGRPRLRRQVFGKADVADLKVTAHVVS